MTIPEPGDGRRASSPRPTRTTRKLAHALERLAIEDPSFRVSTDPETGQIVISGMGELHLEIVVDRLRREFGVEARVGNPQVAYRETITRRAEGENKFVRVAEPGGRVASTATSGWSSSRPTAAAATSTRTAPRAAEIPQEHAPAVEAGVTEAVERGVLAGHPMTDLRVQVVGGSYHPVDSNNYAFKVAGSKAFVAAADKAAPTLLEPVMSLEVVTPDESRGRRPRRFACQTRKSRWNYRPRLVYRAVACLVPMASMFGYATDLRSEPGPRDVHHGIRPLRRSPAADSRQS